MSALKDEIYGEIVGVAWDVNTIEAEAATDRIMQLIDQYAYEYAEKQQALIYKKYKDLSAGLFAVKPNLDKPYPDDPRWTPWSRFVEPREIMLRRAFKGEDIGELEAMGELSPHRATKDGETV